MSIALLLLPDFLVIVAGALLVRLPAFGGVFWRGAERLVYFVLFPALLFRSLASARIAIADSLSLIGTAVAFTACGMALSLLARPLLRLPRADFAACFQCGFRFNTYLALAVAGRLQGPRGIAVISLLVGVLVPLVNLAAVGMLASVARGQIWLAVVRNPLVVACAAGLAWNASGLALPDVADRVLANLGSASLALGLLTVGAALKIERVGMPLSALGYWTLVKLVAMPTVALLVGRALGLSAGDLQLAIVMAAVPTAPSAYVLAVQMGGEARPVAFLITSGTLAAALTMPLWLAATT